MGSDLDYFLPDFISQQATNINFFRFDNLYHLYHGSVSGSVAISLTGRIRLRTERRRTSSRTLETSVAAPNAK